MFVDDYWLYHKRITVELLDDSKNQYDVHVISRMLF
jgi:hypothetical protein